MKTFSEFLNESLVTENIEILEIPEYKKVCDEVKRFIEQKLYSLDVRGFSKIPVADHLSIDNTQNYITKPNTINSLKRNPLPDNVFKLPKIKRKMYKETAPNDFLEVILVAVETDDICTTRGGFIMTPFDISSEEYDENEDSNTCGDRAWTVILAVDKTSFNEEGIDKIYETFIHEFNHFHDDIVKRFDNAVYMSPNDEYYDFLDSVTSTVCSLMIELKQNEITKGEYNDALNALFSRENVGKRRQNDVLTIAKQITTNELEGFNDDRFSVTYMSYLLLNGTERASHIISGSLSTNGRKDEMEIINTVAEKLENLKDSIINKPYAEELKDYIVSKVDNLGYGEKVAEKDKSNNKKIKIFFRLCQNYIESMKKKIDKNFYKYAKH